MSAEGRRRSRFDFPNAFIAVWIVALFVSFGIVANFTDQNGVIYNLGQGLLVALFAGAALFLARWLAVRRMKRASQTGPTVRAEAQGLGARHGNDVVYFLQIVRFIRHNVITI